MQARESETRRGAGGNKLILARTDNNAVAAFANFGAGRPSVLTTLARRIQVFEVFNKRTLVLERPSRAGYPVSSRM